MSHKKDHKEKKKHSKTSNFISEFLDFVKDIVIIVLLVLFIKSYFVMPFQINGQSMYTSYYDKEFIIVDRFSYLDIFNIKTGTPERGDVVVFKPYVSETKEYFIKRIIGVPGDTIKIENGKVFLLNKENKFIEVDEPDLEVKDSTFTRGKNNVFQVPPGEYFVMGDNRGNSTDSRHCFSFNCDFSIRDNYIDKSKIVGKVFIDLGYYDWLRELNIKPFSLKFGSFSFTHPSIKDESGENLQTTPKWFSSLGTYDYLN